MLNFELDTIDEKHELASAPIAHYKQQAARYYNKKRPNENLPSRWLGAQKSVPIY